MVAVLGRWIFALFALLSPVMAIGTWLESKRRARRGSRAGSRRFAAELKEFRAALEDRARHEVDRRWKSTPHPAELLRWASAPSMRLWERRSDSDGFLTLHGGVGTRPWRPPLVSGAGKLAPEVDDALGAVVLTDVPIGVGLAEDGVLGVVGDRQAVLAAARSLLLQATTLSGPADLQVSILTEPARVDDWEWAKWLPHTADASGAEAQRRLAGDLESREALLRILLADGEGLRTRERHRAGPVSFVVLDADGLTEGRNAPARAVLRGEGGPVAGLVIADAVHRLPAMCTTVIELVGTDGEARLSEPQQAEAVESFLVAGVAEPVARRWGRELARFEDPEVAVPGTGLPEAISLPSVLEVDPFDVRSVTAHWRRGADEGRPVTTIGISEQGVLRIDLDADGPHGLVVGTTGSGKSELLRCLVAGLAITLDPDHLNFLLFDYKGGSAFDHCASLPHTVGLVTDLDESLGGRALKILEEELRRRERVLRSAGATDVNHYLRLQRDSAQRLKPLPRLVVVIDEFATMAAELPKFIDALVDVAQRGRALGIHLILATQRPSGALSANIKANTNLRIALRVQAEGDSIESIGTGDAAVLPRRLPGRGFVRLGPDEVLAFQAARVSQRSTEPDAILDVSAFRFGVADRLAEPAGDTNGDPSSDLAALVSTVNAAVEAGGLRRPRQLWSNEEAADMPSEVVELPGLLGIEDVGSFDPLQSWRQRSPRDTLRAQLGVAADAETVSLDLKEAADGGMGPHGLVIGATGSGKSELLRTLVTALAITHSPEDLSFVLVDFKGGATFAGMAPMPHVAGLITNLEDDLALVDRMRDALMGEQRRRQELLRAAGNLASIGDYQALRTAGTDLEPLPALLVIVDEFAELLSAKPDFIDLFVSIGRLGRSLGIHLLLSSQRLEEGRLRGLESHIRYRIGLRTFSAQESRTVLGAPDAYELPSEPGVGYLKVDTTTFTRFKAALVSTPYVSPSHDVADRRTVLDVVVDRLAAAADPVHQVWLPPLKAVVTLDQLLPELVVEPDRGLVAGGWPGIGQLAAPIGVVDRPEEQKQSLLVVSAGGAAGNLAVVGAPQTGKSTLLWTFVAAFALTHTPAEAQFYCIDYGGGGLATLEALPHVGAVATRLEPDKVRRMVAEVVGVLAQREALFRERGIDSVASMRALRHADNLPEERLGDVFLMVDNWLALRQAFEDLEPSVLDLAARGLGYGIHVVVTANRWIDIRANLRDSLRGRFELRLADPAESVIDRRAGANVAADVPGRGLVAEKLHFQAAVPRVDGKAEATDLQASLEELVAKVASSWPGPTAAPVRLLPPVMNRDQLPQAGDDSRPGVPIALVETDLSPFYLDLEAGDPHFLVFGDGESGKTNLLRTFVAGLCARRSHEEVRVEIIDYRRTLLDIVEPDHLGFYAGAAPAATEGVRMLREVLAKRLPGADVSTGQLRERSWWSGPEHYLVVDDYDLVAGASANPLSPLVEFLAQGRDLGFHLILARRVAGAQRALLEPILLRAKELGSAGLILSGDRAEGPLLSGCRAAALPPGRGLLVRRKDEPVLVQVAWTPDPSGPA